MMRSVASWPRGTWVVGWTSTLGILIFPIPAYSIFGWYENADPSFVFIE